MVGQSITKILTHYSSVQQVEDDRAITILEARVIRVAAEVTPWTFNKPSLPQLGNVLEKRNAEVNATRENGLEEPQISAQMLEGGFVGLVHDIEGNIARALKDSSTQSPSGF